MAKDLKASKYSSFLMQELQTTLTVYGKFNAARLEACHSDAYLPTKIL